MGIKALDNYEKLKSQLSSSEADKFFLKNLRLRLKIFSRQKDSSKKELDEAIKNAAVYYNNMPSIITSNLEFTKALMYFQSGQYDLAKNQCNRALNIAKKVYGGNIVSHYQAHMHIMLGKVYEKKEKYNFALEEYKKCLKFYSNRSYGRIINFYEYGELLSSLCSIYYKQKKYPESKFYFQKLVANFDLDHEIVEKLIKKLPVEYMYQISGN